ncbi:MAG TPA: hypothetical protein VGI81_28835 [Tepidisphaeraceae bacterium]
MTVESPADVPGRSRVILILLALALALRIGWAVTRPVNDAAIDALPDQREYLSLAQNLLHGGGLQFIDPRFNEAVKAFRTPGYPMMVAACGASVRAVRIVQALLDVSTVLAIYLLARRLIGGRFAPLLAAGIVAVNPYLIYFTGLLLSETLFTAMLAWAMVLLVIGRGGRGPWLATVLWLAGGLLLSLSVLVRHSAVALPVLLGLLSVFLNTASEVSYKQLSLSAEDSYTKGVWRLPPGLTMVMLTLLSLLPWVVRNRVVLGHWIWLDTNSGFTLCDGYNPDATGASDQSFVHRMPELQALDEVGRDEHLKQEAIDYARTHPERAVMLAGAKLARTWSPVPLSREYGRPALRLLAMAYSVPFDALVLIGLLWGRLRRSAKVFLITPAIYFSIIHMLTVGSLRYRIPIEPPLAVVAAGLVGAGGAASWRRALSA